MRHPHPARPWMLAGLLMAGAILAPRVRAEPPDPIPGADDETRTVSILEARDAGEISVVARGKGEDHVRLAIRNKSPHRLKVILPPGLVAAAATGQLQSMGLGAPDNVAGAFGAFTPGIDTASSAPRGHGVAVPAGQAVDLVVPSVCLNFGLPNPTIHDVMKLMDVDEFTREPIARKALRSLATLGTSQNVAQAVAWHAFNGLTLDDLAHQAVRPFNASEMALAEGFLARLEEGISMAEGRVTIQVRGEGALVDVARRLDREVDGLCILGLPARSAVAPSDLAAPALHLEVSLKPGRSGAITQGRLTVRYAAPGGSWTVLGAGPIKLDSSWPNPDGASLTAAIDRAIASAFVTARPVRRTMGLTTLRIDNRLPFTLANIVVVAGDAPVCLEAQGIGPGRHGMAAIPAAKGNIERVKLNGL